MDTTATLAQELSDDPVRPDRSELRRYLVLIAMGLFITTIGQPGLIGRLPFNKILKNEMHLDAQGVANFWAYGNFAWYLKPLAGLICDSIPLFQTRRRWYLLLSSLGAALLWIVFAFLPRQYTPFLWTMVGVATLMVFASTVTGGLLVEEGQKYNATGRLSSMRFGIEGIISLIAGPLGGYLATRAFGFTVGIGAALLFSLVPTTFFLLRETPSARYNREVWTNAGEQFRNILGSRTMWAAVGLLFLVYIAPGFSTPLYFYQTDTLKFSDKFIGSLQAIGGVSGLLGALVYGYYCKRLSLRTLLFLGILFNIGSTLFYLFYKSATIAQVIEAGNGFFATLGALPLFDMAARATPKGSESFGYALMMSVRNFTMLFLSEKLGAYIFDHNGHQFLPLVWLNAGTTALVLFALPFLPASMMARRDGD